MIGESGRHALAFHAGDLKSERDDQGRVNGGREERLEPRDELVLPHAEALGKRISRWIFDLEVEGGDGGLWIDAGLNRYDYSFRYSRSRLVCVRLTGISVPFVSFIRRI